MKLEVVIVAAFIGAENTALTFVAAGTAVAPSAGVVELTAGAVAPAATVVKLHVTALDSAWPSAAFTVVSSFAVYVVPAASAAVGVSVAVLELPS